MSKSSKHTREEQGFKADFLKSNATGGTLHQEKFGMEIPDNYFSTSKSAILDLVAQESNKTKVFYLRKPFQIAASITLLIALAIAVQFFGNNSSDFLIEADNILVESLLLDDEDMNSFIDEVVVAEIVVEAEKSEQELENIFINSLFVEDSLIDSYTNESLLDNIIL